MVNIKLDSQISLTSDSKQWMLEKEGRAFAYYSTLEDALKSYFELKIRGSDSKSIHSLLSYHKLLRTALCDRLTSFEIEVVKKKSKSHSENTQINKNSKINPLPDCNEQEVANNLMPKVAEMQPITQNKSNEVLKV